MSTSRVENISGRQDLGTPQYVIDWVQESGKRLELDVCARMDNAKCGLYITPEQDTFKTNWAYVLDAFVPKSLRADSWAWMNPEYGRQIGSFLERAEVMLLLCGVRTVALLPARVDTQWWKKYLTKRSTNGRLLRYSMDFVVGRIAFEGQDNGAKFPSVLVYFEKVERPLVQWVDLPHPRKRVK